MVLKQFYSKLELIQVGVELASTQAGGFIAPAEAPMQLGRRF